ncbi:MAG TPA: ATP-dependent Clp protease proteolytic subunit [Acidimicrobiales bacterium]|jgi:ATP-dependent Clp protease protease subunit|nr:ATP-dependent Clp protease proteolytic subunit [Acidimicrobiales bacterium]
MAEPFPPGPWSSIQRALFDRRVVLLNGTVGQDQVDEAVATLLALDALSDERVELRLTAESDSLDVAFALMDAIDSLDVAVTATVIGWVAGTVVGVLASCSWRRIGPLGHLRLGEPTAGGAGVATDLSRQAREFEDRVSAYVRRLAEATGRPFEHIEADLRAGRVLDAHAALAYGLVDELLATDA